MILIIGGVSQGKAGLARELSGRRQEEFAANQAKGGRDPLEAAWEKPFLTDFHCWIRQLTEAEENPEDFLNRVLAAEPEIITMDEVGCGIVPIEKKEREYREAAGRAGQCLARQASQVYRVVCGIPTRIK